MAEQLLSCLHLSFILAQICHYALIGRGHIVFCDNGSRHVISVLIVIRI